MKKSLILLFCIMMIQTSFAQDASSIKLSRKEIKKQQIDSLLKSDEEGIIKSKRHFLAGFKFISDGYGGFIEYGVTKSSRKSSLFQLEIAERKHLKEEKYKTDLDISTPFVFGKLNYFYPIKIGYQQQILLGNKGNKNGVNITANFGGGLSLALLKPYYVQFEKIDGEVSLVKFSDPNINYFLDSAYLIGAPSFSQGWNQLNWIPGLYVKPSLRFDYGRFNETISALEIGLNAEYYTKKIPQLLNFKQEYFLGAYVSVLFGRRK